MGIKSWQLITSLVTVSALLVAMEVPPDTWFGSAAASLAAGVAALTLMAAAAALSARWQWVESCFGGLDRVYLVHKWLGVWALGLASFHLLFKAGMPAWDTAAIVTMPANWTRLLRQLSYVGLVFIVVLALNRNIRYGTWRLWHKLSGPLFMVVILHWLSFKSPIALASPAGTWLAVLASLGVAAAFYKLALYPLLSRHAEYRIVSVSAGASAAHLQLEPVGKGIDFVPGQFGFLRMKQQGLREPHPFTIASSNHADGRIEFVVRALGDFTDRLVASATVGMRAEVHAPFGRFARRGDASREVWIGGGVGISPFIAWLKDPSIGGFENVTLFYFHTPGRDFPEVAVMQAMAHACGAELVAVAGGPSDVAFTEGFARICGEGDPGGVDIAFCGPRGLMAHVRARMREHHVPEANLRHEHFEFR